MLNNLPKANSLDNRLNILNSKKRLLSRSDRSISSVNNFNDHMNQFQFLNSNPHLKSMTGSGSAIQAKTLLHHGYGRNCLGEQGYDLDSGDDDNDDDGMINIQFKN